MQHLPELILFNSKMNYCGHYLYRKRAQFASLQIGNQMNDSHLKKGIVLVTSLIMKLNFSQPIK